MGKIFKNLDKPLLFTTIIFCLFGLLMIFSSSSVSTVLRYHVNPAYFFTKQVIFLAFSVFIGMFVLSIKTYKYNYIIWFLIIGVVVSLLGLFVYGKITGGAQSWYDLKFFKFQPSEFAKTIIILFNACYYDVLTKRHFKNMALYFVPLGIEALIIGLVMLQPDFGSAMIIACISFFMFISVPNIKKNFAKVLKTFVIIAVVGGLVFLYSGSSLLNSTQLSRLNFKNPCQRYTESTGYQVCNGFIAMKNGGLFGLGLGNSTQKYLYLPESHTDFIFPIIVEELGFVTGAIVIIMYAFLLYRILMIARKSENLRCSMICYGTFIYLAIHILINLLGILALIPLTGVPLPFLSYGGSFTFNVLIMLFLVQRCAVENKENRLKREIKEL